MKRFYYSDAIQSFLLEDNNSIIGKLTTESDFDIIQTQRLAWSEEIRILKECLVGLSGSIVLEYAIPRMGKRIDAVLLIQGVIFVLEFKVGEENYSSSALDQVWEYTLDLKNFHEPSHSIPLVPILVATKAKESDLIIAQYRGDDQVYSPVRSSAHSLQSIINSALSFIETKDLDFNYWINGRYCPTPTIIEAAMALYRGHDVKEISRSDAGAENLTLSSATISTIIKNSKLKNEKAICLLTGVPGAGKTLVGLDIATKHTDKTGEMYSVFLSGNGPLVDILREALARDKVAYEKERGNSVKKSEILSEVKLFIQNVHHFRDDCLASGTTPPVEHVALFDEAQRAWNLGQTSKFMAQKKGVSDFGMSEPEFLISCLDRHPDWAVVVCLIGGGQEINTGEAGIGEWIRALTKSYPNWRMYISPKIHDEEYSVSEWQADLAQRSNVTYLNELHLAVSMRSFRAEFVSSFVKKILDLNIDEAQTILRKIIKNYPIFKTRDLNTAKAWLKDKARGNERYGIVVSSQAQRLKPYAIDVKSPVDPIHWFLDDKSDVRSSYYLEDVVTEFQIQGLEVDWACVMWDADFRYSIDGWEHWSFVGDRWNKIRKKERQLFLKNAYRVLLTRARQGMVIVVPSGNDNDATRIPSYYNTTFEYLDIIGIPTIQS